MGLQGWDGSTGMGRVYVSRSTGKGRVYVGRSTGMGRVYVGRSTGMGRVYVGGSTGMGRVYTDQVGSYTAQRIRLKNMNPKCIICHCCVRIFRSHSTVV